MKLLRGFAARIAALLAVALATAAPAATIAGNSSGSLASLGFWGQSFTVDGSGSFDTLRFSFLNGSNAVANGTLSIFSAPFGGIASASNDATGNLVARSTGTENGAYVFDSSVMLTGGTRYYAYADRAQTISYSAFDVLNGGSLYQAALSFLPYGTQLGDARFLVTANAVSPTPGSVPEPSSWAMMILGFGAIGGALRRQRQSRVSLG